jgi:hypothetical protein
LVHLGELGPGAGQADFQSFGFAEPAVAFGFGDAGGQVVADLDQARALGGVGAQQRAPQTALTGMILTRLRQAALGRRSRRVFKGISFVGHSGVSPC